jgi:hypothetical protein
LAEAARELSPVVSRVAATSSENKEQMHICVAMATDNLNTSLSTGIGTTINRATGGYQRLDESGRLISKREMRDEVEPFDLQRGDDS